MTKSDLETALQVAEEALLHYDRATYEHRKAARDKLVILARLARLRQGKGFTEELPPPIEF